MNRLEWNVYVFLLNISLLNDYGKLYLLSIAFRSNIRRQVLTIFLSLHTGFTDTPPTSLFYELNMSGAK